MELGVAADVTLVHEPSTVSPPNSRVWGRVKALPITQLRRRVFPAKLRGGHLLVYASSARRFPPQPIWETLYPHRYYCAYGSYKWLRALYRCGKRLSMLGRLLRAQVPCRGGGYELVSDFHHRAGLPLTGPFARRSQSHQP